MRRLGKILWVGLLGLVVTGMTLWGMGVLSYAPPPTPFREGLAATFGLAPAGRFWACRTACPRSWALCWCGWRSSWRYAGALSAQTGRN